jgi:putative PIN family toxin of toxin-antitoxin system
MRVVVDTDVLVAALRSSRGASRRCLLAALRGEITALVSTPLVLEYEAVLTRADHLSAAGATAADVGLLLDDLVASSEWVRLDYLWRPTLKDPDDEMVLETAANGRADILATFNLTDLAAVAARFGIRAVRPRDLITLGELPDAQE